MSLLGVVSIPQDPQNWVGMVSMAAKFCPQVFFMTQEKNCPVREIYGSNSRVLAKKGYIQCHFGRVYAP